MKNKKILFLLIFVLIIILFFIFLIIKNYNGKNKKENLFSDYTPEEEISSTQLRETIVTLYFVDSNNELKNEGRLIDSVTLLQNPYKELVNLLISGSKSDTLKSVFPENTQILDASIKNGQVTLNFSSELLNYKDDVQKYNIINCILNTLSNLNEVNSFKILINGESSENFIEEYSIK